jgi:hypothetical protein
MKNKITNSNSKSSLRVHWKMFRQPAVSSLTNIPTNFTGHRYNLQEKFMLNGNP